MVDATLLVISTFLSGTDVDYLIVSGLPYKSILRASPLVDATLLVIATFLVGADVDYLIVSGLPYTY